MVTGNRSKAIETIQAMRRQLEHYCVSDYLSDLPAIDVTMNAVSADTPVNAGCRFVMATWCNQIADYCQYKRETVAIAMNCLDRFMTTPTGREILFDRDLYQLAVMTVLYSSVKIHEQEAMDPNLISTLSQGAHTPQAVEAMELKILSSIRWRLNPPTAMSFVRTMIELMSENQLIDSSTKETIIDIAKFQIDMITNEYAFCHTYDSSYIAFACLLNAIESVTNDGMLLFQFKTTMDMIMNTNYRAIQELCMAIYELVNENGIGVQSKEDSSTTKAGQSCVDYSSTKGNSIYSSPTAVNSYNI